MREACPRGAVKMTADCIPNMVSEFLVCGEGYIIALDRNLGEFLIASASEAGEDIGSYGLSKDPKELHFKIS